MNYVTYQQSKLNHKKYPIKPFSRTMSGFFSHITRGVNNNEFTTSTRNIISPLTNSAFNRNYFMKNTNFNLNINVNDENFNKIKKMWNEVCVISS